MELLAFQMGTGKARSYLGRVKMHRNYYHKASFTPFDFFTDSAEDRFQMVTALSL